MKILLALAPWLLSGIGLVLLLWPRDPGRSAFVDLPLQLALGCLIGPGVGSLLYYFWMLVGDGVPGAQASLPLKWGEIGLAGGIFLAAVVQRSAPRPWIRWRALREGLERGKTRLAAFSAGGFAVFAAVFGLALVRHELTQPHGTFDAYAIWNQRARFLFRLGADWRQAFDPNINWKFHADYPLLLPLNVVRLWTAAGSEVLRAPQVLSVLFALALAGVLFGALWSARRPVGAAVAGCLLLGTPWLLMIASAQTADVPLAGYLLGTAALLWLSLERETPPDGWMALAGLCAGLAAWTKNEGQLFALVALACAVGVAVRRRGVRSLIAFLLGAALPAAALISFKLWLAAPGDLFVGQTLADLLAKLVDGSRYVTILAWFGRLEWNFGGWGFPALPLLALAALLLWKRPIHRAPLIGMLVLLGLTLAGYMGIYLITPHPLEWHLNYSADRLLFHLYPLLLFILFQGQSTFTE
jgi:hypothetical protein